MERHERQIDILVCPKDIQPYVEAEGGVCIFERFEGQRLVLFQGSWLSNFQLAKFHCVNNVVFNCTEQAFQAMKALFVAHEASKKKWQRIADAAMALYQKIMKSTNALYQKLSASSKYLYMDKEMLDKWSLVSGEVMLQLNRLKFKQNKHLLDRLLSLNECAIVEAVPDDTLWGIGMSAKSAIFGLPADLDMSIPENARLRDWKGLIHMTREEIESTTFAGQNRQGRILQHLLQELRAESEQPLPDSTDTIRALVAELFRLAQPAEDEDSPEKQAFYANLGWFEAVAAAAPNAAAVMERARKRPRSDSVDPLQFGPE